MKNTKAIGNKNTITICKMKEKKLGFSKGCAAFAPKKPPPFEPSSFIGNNGAAGPVATVTVSPVKVVICCGALNVAGTPLNTNRIAVIIHNGNNILVSECTKSL